METEQRDLSSCWPEIMLIVVFSKFNCVLNKAEKIIYS